MAERAGPRPARAAIEQLVAGLAGPIAERLGLELVEVQFVREHGRHILRVAIDKPGGVGIADCEAVSRALDAALDAQDPIPHSYALEVSSPGIERPLKKPADFVRFAGRTAVVRLFAPWLGRKRWTGRLAGLSAAGEVLLVPDGAEQPVAIPAAAVSRARLVFDSDALDRRRGSR